MRRMALVALGVALATTSGATLALAEEGDALTLSHTAVSLGQAFTVTGAGCATPTAYVVDVAYAGQTHTVHTDADGTWTTILQVPEDATEPLTIKATCTPHRDAAWSYAESTVAVASEPGQGLDPRTEVVASDTSVSMANFAYLQGVGCPAGATLVVDDGLQKSSRVLETGGTWEALSQVMPETEDTERTLAVSCVTADEEWAYPPVTFTLLKDGDRGIPTPPLPDTGDPTESPTPSASVIPSASPSTTQEPQEPGLPSTGW